MIDYLVVGLGLAGISFCEQLEENKKSYKVINDGSQTASLVAGGLYNPVILKRFTLAWNADVQLETAMPFYDQLESKLEVKLDCKIPIYRKFASIEEQNLWFEAADKPRLDKFLSTRIIENDNKSVDASAPTASQPAIQLLLLSGNAVVLSGRIEQSEERQALDQSTIKLQRVATVKADAPSAISPLLRDADEIWLARLNVDVLNYGDAIDGYFPISKTIILVLALYSC